MDSIDLKLTNIQAESLLITIKGVRDLEEYPKWHVWLRNSLDKIEIMLREKGISELT